MSFDPAFWAMQCVAMLLTCLLIPKLTVSGPIPALLTVITLAFINSHIWSTALFLKIPDELAYRAILLLLANGLLFWIVVKIIPGIEVSGVFAALLAPVVFSAMSLFIDQYKDEIDWTQLSKAALEITKNIKDYFAESAKSSSLMPASFLSESNGSMKNFNFFA